MDYLDVILKNPITGYLFTIASDVITTGIYNYIEDRKAKKSIKTAFDKAVKKYNKENKNKIKISLEDVQYSELAIKNKDFIAYFASELRHSELSYLYLLECKLNDINHYSYLNSIIENDERNSSEVSDDDFFEIYPGAGISIKDLSIEPVYKILKINESGDKIVSERRCDDHFISSCKKILEENRYLFITGPYGHGKTFLSKLLLSKIDDGFTLFFYASNLPTSNSSFRHFFNPSAIKYFINRYKKLYIFIDSLEDILIENSVNIFEQLNKIHQRFPNVYFIINCRTSEGLRPIDVYEYIRVFWHTDTVIELCSFTNLKISEWMDEYSKAVENKQKISFTIEDVKRANKNLQSSFCNPLLLLIMSQNDMNTDDINSQNWFNHFDNFVNLTIQGKFSKELKSNAFLTKKGVNPTNYKDFISKAALTILKNQKQKLDLEKFNREDYFLDPNDTSYLAPNSMIINDMKDCFGIDKNDFSNNKDAERYLNCYFFECKKIGKSLYWKFRDNNILFFLCANKLYNMLEDACQNYKNKTEEAKEIINHLFDCISNIPLHPVIIEFVLDNIHHTKDGPDTVLGFINLLIENNEALTIPEREKFNLDYNRIKIDIFLFIIYIRFHYYSYNSYNDYLFKRASQYHSLIKKIDEDLASVIKRYFKNVIIIGAQFRGINIKRYNWSNSKLTNVTFYRCKVSASTFYRNYFRKTSFNLCLIRDIKFEDMGGSLQFKSSELSKTSFVIPNNTVFDYNNDNPVIDFYNCVIDDVTIMSESTTLPIITFRNCDIKQLHFKCKRVYLNLNNSDLSSQIDLKQTHLTVSYSTSNCTLNNVFAYNNIYDSTSYKPEIKDISKLFDKDQSSVIAKEPLP